MATVIRNDSLNNLNQSLQFLAQQNQRRKAQDLETAIALNRMGKNKEAEELILSSQRGIIGNLFGSDAEGWKAEGVYKQPDAQFEEATDMQGGLLASLLDKKSANYNPDQYNYMTKQNQVPSGLGGVAELKKSNIDPFVQSAEADNLKSKIDNFKRQQADGTVSYNRKAEEFNTNNSKYKNAYTGDAVDQHQQLLDDTQLAMDNARSEQDRLKIYNKYVTTEKSISNHYQEKSDVQGPAFFGIGQNKSNGSSGKGKSDYYLYGDTEQVIEVPAAYMKNSKSREEYIAKQYPDIYSQGTVLKRAGTTGGTDMNEYQSAQTKLVNRELQAMDQAKATSAVEKHDTMYTSYGTAIEKTNADLESQGANYRVNGSGEIYYLKSPNRVESVNTNPPVQNTNPPTVDTSRWRRTK